MWRIYLPVLTGNVKQSRSGGFVMLFMLESTCRALMMTVVPLQAYKLLGDAQMVSLVYLFVSVSGLIVSLGLPMVMHLLTRRWMMSLGALTYLSAACLYATGTIPGMIAGLACQITATAILEVTINLYLMDHIQRKELNAFEPHRVLYSGMAFTVGPWLGVYLNESLIDGLAYLALAITTLIMLVVFWILRLTDNPSVRSPKKQAPNPLAYIPDFLKQPRLVLAWALTVGRNGWWLMFFVYTPIFVTEAGYSAQTGGALVSLGVMPMILVRVWGRIGQRTGIRHLLMVAYMLTGTATIAAGAFASWPLATMPLVTMGLLWLSAFLATVIDGAGNVPFLRAVKARERAEMTAVYITHRHGTALFAPGLFAVVLAILPLPFVFVSGGIAGFGMAWLSKFLPKRL